MPARVAYASVPFLVAILLGFIMSATQAPLWVCLLISLPLVFWGTWWQFIRREQKKSKAVH